MNSSLRVKEQEKAYRTFQNLVSVGKKILTENSRSVEPVTVGEKAAVKLLYPESFKSCTDPLSWSLEVKKPLFSRMLQVILYAISSDAENKKSAVLDDINRNSAQGVQRVEFVKDFRAYYQSHAISNGAEFIEWLTQIVAHIDMLKILSKDSMKGALVAKRLIKIGSDKEIPDSYVKRTPLKSSRLANSILIGKVAFPNSSQVMIARNQPEKSTLANIWESIQVNLTHYWSESFKGFTNFYNQPRRIK